MQYLILSDIRLPYTTPESEVFAEAKSRLRRAGMSFGEGDLSVFKKSLDARKKDDIRFVYSLLFRSEKEYSPEKLLRHSLVSIPDPYGEIKFETGKEKCKYSPLVVGMGPCGLFAALMLAKNGYRPTVIDRGGCIKERVACVQNFTENRILDSETNVQFGAGGAGTFSDGKLVTRIKDPATSFVLATLRKHGAPENVVTSAKPHIGTDVLRGVVDSILREIEELGGTVVYNCKLESFEEKTDCVVAKTAKGDIPASSVILAVGHSSRDTYSYLMESGFSLAPKNFSVGVRVEHLKSDIDRSLYGDKAGDTLLPAGEYALSDTKGERGVYTFCMCPGGYVMASASEEGGVVTNGMSEYGRDGKNSNAAMLVSVTPEDFSGSIREAIAFQRRLERDAFTMGGGDYSAPALTVGDFLRRECKTEFSKVEPTYMGGGVRLSPIYEKMPAFLFEGLSRGFESFGKKLSAYKDPSAVMTGFETRTSSPLRILRTSEMNAVGHPRIYPAGEGAGYAGGITSAACDGIRVAGKIAERFKPN